jgi:hypothetical protein
MSNRVRPAADYDSPWKVALHRYLRWFLAFFFPPIEADIDWSRGYETLDKEFQQLIRRTKVGIQIADMLFKIGLQGGSECWLLIHVEIQGRYEIDFARQMFDYNTAAYKLYNREAVSLAVLCDERPTWRPTKFSYGRWGSRTEITFPVVKLLDYAHDREALERHANPFAMVVLAHLQSLATPQDPALRRSWKLRLVKSLYERKLTKENVRELFRLLDWILVLPDDLQEQFREDVHHYEQEKRIPYLSSLERMAMEKGHKRGREEGLQVAHDGIALALEARFGPAGRKLGGRVRRITDVAELRRLSKIIKAAQSVDDVRPHLS